MAFEEVQQEGNGLIPVWDFITKKEMVGFYMGKQEGVGPNLSNLYQFKLKDGTFCSVWGSTVIDDLMKTVEAGDLTKIIYEGKKLSPKTNRSTKIYKIYVDDAEKMEIDENEIPDFLKQEEG